MRGLLGLLCSSPFQFQVTTPCRVPRPHVAPMLLGMLKVMTTTTALMASWQAGSGATAWPKCVAAGLLKKMPRSCSESHHSTLLTMMHLLTSPQASNYVIRSPIRQPVGSKTLGNQQACCMLATCHTRNCAISLCSPFKFVVPSVVTMELLSQLHACCKQAFTQQYLQLCSHCNAMRTHSDKLRTWLCDLPASPTAGWWRSMVRGNGASFPPSSQAVLASSAGSGGTTSSTQKSTGMPGAWRRRRSLWQHTRCGPT